MRNKQPSFKELSVPAVTAPWVLIVDDDVLSGRALARRVAERFGVRVCVARSLHGLAQLIKKWGPHPSAVVLDYQLSQGETGLDALRQLCAAGSKSKMAFLTGAPDELRLALSSANLANENSASENSASGDCGTPTPLIFARSSSGSEIMGWLGGTVQRGFESGEYYSVPALEKSLP